MELYKIQRQDPQTQQWEDIELDYAKNVVYEEALGFIKKVKQRGGKIDSYRVTKVN